MQDLTSDQLRAVAVEARRGAARLARRLRTERSPEALSSNKVGVLAHLDRYGPASPGEIAVAGRQRSQTLTRVFAELEAAGLISRSPSERDGRGAVLRLTDAGSRVLSADMAERDTWLASAIAELTPAEARLLAIAGALMDQLADS